VSDPLFSSMPGIGHQLGYFLSYAFRHGFRQTKAPVQGLLAMQQFVDLVIHGIPVIKGPQRHPGFTAHIQALTEQAQYVHHGIPDLFAEMQPVRPFSRYRLKEGADFGNFRCFARVVILAIKEKCHFSLPVEAPLPVAGQPSEFLQQGVDISPNPTDISK